MVLSEIRLIPLDGLLPADRASDGGITKTALDLKQIMERPLRRGARSNASIAREIEGTESTGNIDYASGWQAL
jgi:hypothetical protein